MDSLPFELYRNIVFYLPRKDLQNIAKINHEWYKEAIRLEKAYQILDSKRLRFIHNSALDTIIPNKDYCRFIRQSLHGGLQTLIVTEMPYPHHAIERVKHTMLKPKESFLRYGDVVWRMWARCSHSPKILLHIYIHTFELTPIKRDNHWYELTFDGYTWPILVQCLPFSDIQLECKHFQDIEIFYDFGFFDCVISIDYLVKPVSSQIIGDKKYTFFGGVLIKNT